MGQREKANQVNPGIGTTGTGYTLTVSGTAWVTSGAWSGSDIRWKQNITSLQSSLDRVMQLKPVNFDWRASEFPNLHFSNGTQIGFIAQDVEKVIPEVVTTDNNGYMISYERITPVLTGAIQELNSKDNDLNAKVAVLEKENAAQQKEINELRAHIAALEAKIK
ncbi:MAG: tail fiber domain-containing protein [Candidatus Aenigmatarchaeota archaeon]